MKIVVALFVLSGIVAAQGAPTSEEFDVGVLTPKGQEAYRALLSIEEARGTSVGIVGFTDPNAALYFLWDDPAGERALLALTRQASPAGRFLALCGLFAVDREQYDACRRDLVGADDPVTVFPGGCVGTSRSLREALEHDAKEIATDLRAHWEFSRPLRHFAPAAGYEDELSPRGREALEVLRHATYVDGAYWVEVSDAFGPLRALYDVLLEPVAADAFIDLIQNAGPAARLYGAGGLRLSCPVAIGNAQQWLASDEALVRVEVEGAMYELTVAEAADVLLASGHPWAHGLGERLRYEEHRRKSLGTRTRGGTRPPVFDRTTLSAEQQHAFDELVRAEVVQLSRWEAPAPATEALFTLWDADDPASAFERLAAVASPAGRVLAVCGMRELDAERARRAELVLKKSGLQVPVLTSDGALDMRMDFFVETLVADGELSRRLRSEWIVARLGGSQADARRELSWEGGDYVFEDSPDGIVEHPYGLHDSGFGVSIARNDSQLFVGGTSYIDPERRGAVFVLSPPADTWTPTRYVQKWKLDQTLLPSSRPSSFGSMLAASQSALAVFRSGRDAGEGAVEVFERGEEGWTRRAEFSTGANFLQDLVMEGETIVAVGSRLALVIERGAQGWQSTELDVPRDANCMRAAVEVHERNRIVVAFGRGGISVFERTPAGWGQGMAVVERVDRPIGRVASLALQGERLFIGDANSTWNGGAGVVEVLEKRRAGWHWAQTLEPSDAYPGDAFGETLALDGDRLAVLAKRGPARLFDLNGERWRLRATLAPSRGAPNDPVPYDSFRAGVCDLKGDSLLVGMPYPRKKELTSRLIAFDLSRYVDASDDGR